MPHSKELDQFTRGRIVQMKEDGHSVRKISSRLSLPKSTIQNTLRRFETRGTAASASRSGRPTVDTPRTTRRILRNINTNQWDTWSMVSRHTGYPEHQVQRVAKKHGIYRRIARTAPHLSERNIKDRQQWCEINEGRSWKDQIWTDETIIELGKHQGIARVSRTADQDPYSPNLVQKSHRSGQDKIMLWGCITANKRGPAIILEMPNPYYDEKRKRWKNRGLDANAYTSQVLEGPLQDFWEEVTEEVGKEVWVMEDGAPPHQGRAKKVRRELGIPSAFHPGNSPDLNPIEPLWDVLKRRIWDIPGSHNSLSNLRAAALQAWSEITTEDVVRHTKHMDDRLEEVKSRKGRQTRY